MKLKMGICLPLIKFHFYNTLFLFNKKNYDLECLENVKYK